MIIVLLSTLPLVSASAREGAPMRIARGPRDVQVRRRPFSGEQRW
jgi:hypothetical protein